MSPLDPTIVFEWLMRGGWASLALLVLAVVLFSGLIRVAWRACRTAPADVRSALGPFRSMIAAAPLIGLLGTVSGMIETFAALGTFSVFGAQAGGGASSGVADGISTALVTTQFGLSVAVVGWGLERVVLARLGFQERRLAARATALSPPSTSQLRSGGTTRGDS